MQAYTNVVFTWLGMEVFYLIMVAGQYIPPALKTVRLCDIA